MDTETTRQTLAQKAWNIMVVFLFSFNMLFGTVPVVSAQPTAQSSAPTIKSDLPDYNPGGIVMLTGEGWRPAESISVVVNDDAGNEWYYTDKIVADSSGWFTDTFTLPTQFVATYFVTATGTVSGTAVASFTDANASANLDQCANDQFPSPNTDGCSASASDWVNGNVNASKAFYMEGDSVPYRMTFGSLTLSSHTVIIEWDTTKGGKHALDYLTTFNRTVATANPCLGIAGCDPASFTTYPIPVDPQVSGAGVTQIPGVFTFYGATITAVSAYSYPDGSGFAGDKSAQITITFTPSVANPVLAWGGHISTRQDWGADMSAVTITGSPFHTRLISLDGSGGNQDRSLATEAVVFPGSITIIKDAVPDGATQFPFTASPAPLASFTLVDDGTSANTKAFGGILTFQNYTVTENTPTGWSLAAIVCSMTSPNGGSQTVSIPTVTINLKEGENVICTFTNNAQTGTLIVTKNLVNDNGGTKTCPDFSYTLDAGSAVAFEADCSNSQTVIAGSHTVVEVGAPIEGYTTTYNNCANVNVPAGGSATCTITNDDIAIPAMTVDKSSTTTSLSAPGTVTYDYLVTNTGNVALTGITLSDDNATGMSCPATTLAAGASMTCTATHAFPQEELDANGSPIADSGKLHNVVTADSNETQPVTDSLDIPITYGPAMTVDKSSATTSLSAPMAVTYSYLVTNTGNITLTGIALSDDNATGMICPADTLAVGANMTCTATHAFTQAELDANGSPTAGSGKLHNVVTADSNETQPVTDSLDIPIAQNKAIIVVKASTTALVDQAGQVVPYTFDVSNGGNVTLTGITVTDPKCDAAPEYVSGDANTDNKLQVGEVWKYTCNHTVTQAEIDTDGGGDGDLDNTVTADSNESTPDTDDHAIPIDYSPAMTVDKSSATTSLSAPTTVTYDYLVTNTGNVTLTGITLSDDNATGMSCPDTTLAVGASMTCHATHTFTQAELDAGGTLDNTVTADSNETTPVTDSLSIPIEQSPAIAVDKTSTTTSITAAGQVVPYQFAVTNTGNMTLTGITVSDPNCDAAPAYQSGDANSDSKLQLTETWLYTCNHTVTQTEVDAGGSLSNTVTADSIESAPATDSLDIPIAQNKAIIVVKASTTALVDQAGQVVPYTFDVSNGGNVTLTGITVTDPKCDAAPEYVSGDANTDNKLQVGEVWKYTCNHTVTQAEIDTDGGGDGDLDNTVTADSNESTPDTDDHAIPIDYSPAMTVDKSSATTSLSAPTTVTYSYLVTNTGNVTLTGITLSDDNATGMSCPDTTLAVGASMTCTATHAFTQAELDAGGTLDNTVTADSNETTPVTDSLSIPIERSPAIALTKSASPTTYDHVGQVITYSYVIKNTGNVTLPGPFSVADDKAAVTCDLAPAGGLAPNGTVNCTATYTILYADLAAGSVKNTARASTTYKDQPVNSNEATATVTTGPLPDLTVTKTGTSPISAGDTADFMIVVTNQGAGTAYNVTVTDSLPAGVDWKIDPAVTGCAITGDALSCNWATLAANTSVEINVSGATDATDCGTLNNLITVSAGNEIITDNNSASASITVNCADVTVAKTAVAGKINAGDTAAFKIVVSNIGAGTAYNVTLADTLPAGITWTIDPAVTGCAITGNTLSCSFATLAANASVEINVKGAALAAVCGKLDNTVTVAASNEAKTDNNSASASITVNCADVTVTKEAVTSTINSGDVASFKIVVTNSGAGTAYNVTLNDTLPGSLAWTIDPAVTGCAISGNTLSCSWATLAPDASTTIIVSASTNTTICGKLDNTVTVAASNEVNTSNNSASASIGVSCSDVTVTKTGNGPLNAGDAATFTITVTNLGPGKATNVLVTDALPAGVAWSVDNTACTISGTSMSCLFTSLDANAPVVITVTGTTTADSCGALKNDVAVSAANEDATKRNNNTASASITVNCPDVKVTKTGNGSVHLGQDAIFDIVVENTGAGKAYTVTLTDTLPGDVTWSLVQPVTGCTLAGNNLSCAWASLDPAAKITIQVKATISTTAQCADLTNTVTVTATNEKAADIANNTSTATITVNCPADLIITKTAKPTFTREYCWQISKTVDKTYVRQISGSATFNYTVTVKEVSFCDDDWDVSGKITVTNPNTWLPATITNLTDRVNNGGVCTISGFTPGMQVPAGKSVDLNYSCYYDKPTSDTGTNTATVTWDQSIQTPHNTATATADFTFGTGEAGNPTPIYKTVTIQDELYGDVVQLGTVTATDVPPYTVKVFKYSRSLPASCMGGCKKYMNEAKIIETGQAAYKEVKVCGPARTGALTIGYWRNNNGQAIIKKTATTNGVCKLTAWLRQFAPFKDLSSTADCTKAAAYVYNVIKAANAGGASMNAMLKAQMLATALDVYYSNPVLGGNKINAPTSIGSVVIDLTSIYTGGKYVDVRAAFGGSTKLNVMQMLNYAASKSNAGGSMWYSNVKATQQLAKNAFDAINNQWAFAP